MEFRISLLQSLCLMLLVPMLGAVVPASAQEAGEFPGPEKEHAWLGKFHGEWTTESRGSMGPDQPPLECTGTITSRSLGGFWVVNELKGDIHGTVMTGIQTIGYDPGRKLYVGTWVDSFSSHMWRYEVHIDDTGRILTLEAEGPNFMAENKVTKFQDIYEFRTDTEIVMTSRMLGEDGQWITFMTGLARRKP